jgi:cytochrome b subunit of formate dehydrogenase
MAEKILAARNLVVRHATLELIEHWAIALSGLVLLLTGIFELPVAKRYYIITVSGLVKTYKNIYAPDMSHTVLLMATWIHNIFFVLFFLAFLAHMAAIALRPNWPMVRGIFTGKVRLDYARHRHALWLNKMEQKKRSGLKKKY